MAAPAVETLPSVSTESKSARKKKVKADAGSNDSGDASLATPSDGAKELTAAADPDASGEHPYVRELQKHMRSTNKKLSALQKIDAILSENKGLSLDELVTQRKINTDQRAAVLKKPQLQAQLTQLEEQLDQYRKFDSEYQQKLANQKEELTLEHQKELAKIKAELQVDAVGAGAAELRSKLLTFSQFLRAAAAKRTIEEDADTDESRAFEGALLLVYGGDQKAVDTAINLIEGGSDFVPSIEGVELPVTYAQIKQASVDHAPIQADETWADQATEAVEAHAAFNTTSVDPTIANATLTELEQQGQANKLVNGGTTGATGETSGNAAGERWDTTATEVEKGAIDDSYEIIPRPTDEVDIPADPSQQPQSTRWDEDPPTYDLATGNTSGERWDVKVPGEQTDDSTWATNSVQTNETLTAAADTKAVAADDGFHEVPGRHRGRGGGGRGRGGDGEFRGRGGRRGHFRGGRGGSDGEFRGRGGFRGGRGDGEFRGRGRGRGGPRGGGASAPVSS